LRNKKWCLDWRLDGSLITSLHRRRIRSTPSYCALLPPTTLFFSLEIPPPDPVWPVTRPSPSLRRERIADGDLPRKSRVPLARPSPRPPRLSPKSKSHAHPARGPCHHGLVYIEGRVGGKTLLSSLDEDNGRLMCVVPRIGDVEAALIMT
jgi:hypothetical protein